MAADLSIPNVKWTFQMMAEEEFAESQAVHDQTGVHVWIETTLITDTSERTFICQHCSERKREAFPYVDLSKWM